MSYIVTARKYRPIRFSDVVGQEHITRTLKNAIKNGRIAHAYIFAGPRGVGKTTTARVLAKTLNCLNPVDFEPCNDCEMCNSFNTNQSLDIIEIDGASNRRIEEIRTLRESVKYAPTKGQYKVYIIDEVHMLTNESFNALLKTLEEPPSHTIFIFATTDVHKVPLTIISRCQRYDFRRIELDAIKNQLRAIAENEKIEIDDQSLTIIAKKADGALRDAESIFDQIVAFCNAKIDSQTISHMLNLIDEELYFEVSDAVLEKRFVAAFNITSRIYDNGWNFVDFLNGLVEHFRNIMTIELTSSPKLIEASESAKLRYTAYKDKFSQSDLLRILNFLNTLQQELRITSNQRLKVEVGLCHLIGLEKSASITSVIERLEEAKKKNLNSPSQFHTPASQALAHSEVPAQDASMQTGPADNSLGEPVASSETLSLNMVSLNGTVLNGTVLNSTGHNGTGLNTNSVNGISLNAAASGRQQKEVLPEDRNMFDKITSKWDMFVETIKQEKFITANALAATRPVRLDGNKLIVECQGDYHQAIINGMKEYFLEKTEKIFGRALSFVFQDQIPQAAASGGYIDYSTPEVQEEAQAVKSSEGNPLIDAIKNILDGDEIQ